MASIKERLTCTTPFEVRIAQAVKLNMKVNLLCETEQEARALDAMIEHMGASKVASAKMAKEASRVASTGEKIRRGA